MASVEQLQKIMPRLSAAKAGQFAPALNAARARFGIDALLREAAFLAQLAHESGQFRYMQEIWGPTKWQVRYEGSTSLGNTQPGDGKRFMGRGPIQITGRANYAACGKALGLDLLSNPELLEEPGAGCLSAGWFWNMRKINVPADAKDFHRVTQLINGKAELGYAERLVFYQRALTVLAAADPTSSQPAHVVIDGKDQTGALTPFEANGHLMVRIRPLAGLMNFTLVDIGGGFVTVRDPKGKDIQVAFSEVDGIGYVALRDLPFAACDWDDATRTATVTLAG